MSSPAIELRPVATHGNAFAKGDAQRNDDGGDTVADEIVYPHAGARAVENFDEHIVDLRGECVVIIL